MQSVNFFPPSQHGQFLCEQRQGSRNHVMRLLSKMGYQPKRRVELTDLLLSNLGGLHRKGFERRNMLPY